MCATPEHVGSSGRRALRVVLVSDQSLTSEAVRTALAGKGFDLIAVPTPGSDTHARELARRVASFRPDVGLLLHELDDPLHFRDAIAALRVVPGLRWLLLTGVTDRTRWGAGLEAGAAAVLPMSIGLDDLASALLQVRAGRAVMPERQRARLLDSWQRRSREQRALAERLERLTPRETEVLRALCDGRSVATIAAAGGVSVGTVRSQVKSILKKLEVRSQLAAVAAYQRAWE